MWMCRREGGGETCGCVLGWTRGVRRREVCVGGEGERRVGV